MSDPTFYSVHAAKTHLSRLLERAVAGEEIVIGKAGTPLVRLVPVEARPGVRELGFGRDWIVVPDDHDWEAPTFTAAELDEIEHRLLHKHLPASERPAPPPHGPTR